MITSKETHLKHQVTGWKIVEAITAKLTTDMSELDATLIAKKIFADFGIEQLWHPLCIKFNEHTLKPGIKHRPNPSTLLKDIAIIDIGVVIDGVEVDCGRTVAFQPQAKKLADTSKNIFLKIKSTIETNPSISPKAIYAEIQSLAQAAGNYKQIAPTAGHALGPYPTPKRAPKISLDEQAPQLTQGGWMIEVHISDGQFGAFYEDFVWVS